MKQRKLANELQAMYKDAPKGGRVARIILFGIKYAAELKAAKQAGCSISETIEKIIGKSDLRKSQDWDEKSYISQIKNGMKLAKDVKLKKKLAKDVKPKK